MEGSGIGFGWESSWFTRLRELPNHDVELRDGSGEVWRFFHAGGDYTTPPGLNVHLVRTADAGCQLLDQKNPLKPGASPKTAALNAAKGTGVVRPRVVQNGIDPRLLGVVPIAADSTRGDDDVE